MDLGLDGAAICISGGTKGIGRAAAIAFAREGTRVAVTGRGQAALDDTVAALREAGAADAVGIATDVGDPASIDALFAELDRRWGMLNTLVNMAGPTDPGRSQDFLTASDETWLYHFNIGVMSVVRATRAAVPLMRKAEWGRVVNVSSTSSRLGMPMEAGYMTAKGGLNALSKNMAWTLAPEGILVNTLTPGAVYTEALRHTMVSNAAAAKGYDPDDLHDVSRWVRDNYGARPSGVVGYCALPDEIAPQIVLLGSKANRYVVGANVVMDGGTDFSTG